MIRVLTHASEILTGEGIRKKDGRHIVEDDLGRILDGALVYSLKKSGKKLLPDKVLWVGPTSELPKKYAKAKKTNLKNQSTIIPGLVDCHTHLVFAGNRADEFAARCGGATYEEIAARGGGILSTVRATRQASHQELFNLASARLKESLAYGVRTIEIKSGYGLSFESEIKLLEVIRHLKKEFPEVKISTTFLGAHAYPPDLTKEDYLDCILNDLLPKISKNKLADACDVFVDAGYFTTDEAKQILEKAKKLGLEIRLHADELGNTESTSLAVSLDALSADHLLKISDRGIEALAGSNTVAVLLPGTAFYLKASHAPARALLKAGACVALATDFNPGTCVCLSLPTIMTIAALYLGMTRSEIFAAVTYNGAKALNLAKSRGTLEKGLDAAFTVLPYSHFEELYYHFGSAPFKAPKI